MNIDGLLEFYRKVRLEGGMIGLSNRYVRGPTSLGPVISELLHNHIDISPFNMKLIVIYRIISKSHPEESVEWKLKKTKEIFTENHYATRDTLLDYLQRNSA